MKQAGWQNDLIKNYLLTNQKYLLKKNSLKEPSLHYTPLHHYHSVYLEWQFGKRCILYAVFFS